MSTKRPKYIQHIRTARSITFVYNNKGEDEIFTFPRGKPEYDDLSELIKAKKTKEIAMVLYPELAIKKKVGKRASVKEGKLLIDDDTIPQPLSDRIKAVIDSGNDASMYLKFWDRLKRIKSTIDPEHVKEQLFRHIEYRGVTILPDGRFLMYKGVKNDLTTSNGYGNFKYVVGEYQEELNFNKDPKAVCVAGIHCCPYDTVAGTYHYGFGKDNKSNVLLELIIDPEDVVACPYDAATKIRVKRCFTNRIITNVNQIKSGNIAYPDSEKKLAKMTKMVIEAATDRITIPAEFIKDAGFSSGQTFHVVINDKRSRFVYLIEGNQWITNKDKWCKREKPILDKEIKPTPRLSCSIRDALLRQAQIHEYKEYSAVVKDKGVIEIRPC